MQQSSSSPLCFRDVRGQQKAVRLITRALSSGRISHAYLLKGPDGVGKQLFARGVAASLNCHDTGNISVCGRCGSCLKFLSGSQPDFKVIRPDRGMIKINQLRDVAKILAYPPYESKYRVIVLEDVHTMRAEAANSLLKTLEEPPQDNVLMLTADASCDILSTMSSRCQMIPFFSLSAADTVAILRDKEPQLDEDTAMLLARLSEGSPGRALLLYKQDFIDLFRDVVRLLSDPGVDGDRDIERLFAAAGRLAGLKERLPLFLGLLRLWLRDRLFVLEKGTAGQPLPDFAGGDVEMPKYWSFEALFAKLAAVDRAEDELRRNCNRNLVCEVLFMKLHQ